MNRWRIVGKVVENTGRSKLRRLQKSSHSWQLTNYRLDLCINASILERDNYEASPEDPNCFANERLEEPIVGQYDYCSEIYMYFILFLYLVSSIFFRAHSICWQFSWYWCQTSVSGEWFRSRLCLHLIPNYWRGYKSSSNSTSGYRETNSWCYDANYSLILTESCWFQQQLSSRCLFHSRKRRSRLGWKEEGLRKRPLPDAIAVLSCWEKQAMKIYLEPYVKESCTWEICWHFQHRNSAKTRSLTRWKYSERVQKTGYTMACRFWRWMKRTESSVIWESSLI